MNNKGNIMINLLFFLMGLAVLIVLISPIKSFLDIAQGSNFLNCPGFIDANARPAQNYSYNSSKPSEGLSCLSVKLYLPYLFLVFLIAGVGKLLYDRGTDFMGGNSQPPG